MKKQSTLKTIILSLVVLLISFPLKDNGSKSINDKEIHLNKIIAKSISESEKSIENNEVNNGYSEIKFFLDEPEGLDSIELDRPEPGDSIETSQLKLNAIRERNKRIITENNLKAIEQLSSALNIDSFTMGEYSSVVKLQVPDNTITDNFIQKIQKTINVTSSVEEVFINPICSNEGQNELADAMNNINVASTVQSGLFTGKGINVGIAELDGIIRPSMFPSDYENRNITLDLSHRYGTNHGDQVAMIAAGNNGIARESNIFSTMGFITSTYFIDWFLDNDVFLINTSYGSDIYSGESMYTGIAQEIDQIIRNSYVTMVGSAGNKNFDSNGDLNNKITSPKTAFNYITVGASSANEPKTKLTEKSRYEEDDNYGASKPNLVAPGAIKTNAIPEGDVGTSFAAPQVTGCLALLMEEYPFLMAYPELCLSVLTSSASPMSATYNNENLASGNYYDGSGLHNQIGSGLLNYEKMREAMNDFLSVTRDKNSSAGLLSQSIDFTAEKGKRVRASLAWLASGDEKNNFTNYDLRLYRVNDDGTTCLLKYIDSADNNVEFLDYTFGNDGNYRLSIYQNETNLKQDFIALSYVLIDGNMNGSTSGGITTHTCSNYIDVVNDIESHYVSCDCGYSVLEEHDLSINDDYIFCSNCDFNQGLLLDVIKSTDYGYPGEYNNTTSIWKEIQTTSGNIINTNRLRCGYISDSYLTLSAKNVNATSAFLEYYYPNYLYSLNYNLGLWSDDESLIRNSSIRLEALDSLNNWVTVRTFDAKEMSTDKDCLLLYSDALPFATKAFRFIVETNQVQNNNNRGRVVIGDIEVKQFDLNNHNHIFKSYEQYSNSQHISTCYCGTIDYSAHTIDQNSKYTIGGIQYGRCVYCNALVNLGSTPVVSPIV